MIIITYRFPYKIITSNTCYFGLNSRTISTFLPHIRQSKFNQKILILFLLKFIDKVTKILLGGFSSILILFSFDTKDTSLAPNSIKILFNDSRPPIFAI